HAVTSSIASRGSNGFGLLKQGSSRGTNVARHNHSLCRTAGTSSATGRPVSKECAMTKTAVITLMPTLLATTAAQAEAPRVESWTPAGISSPQFESHPAFDPLTKDFYFVRSSPKFEGWRLMVSTCTDQGWSPPRSPGFAGDGVEADPWFANGGHTLYFIS